MRAGVVLVGAAVAAEAATVATTIGERLAARLREAR